MKIGMLSKFMPEKDGIAIYSEELSSELGKLCNVIRIGDVNSKSADYRLNFRSFQLKSHLQKIIEKENLDVLHIQYIAAYFGKHTLNLNLLEALSQKIPVVCTMHEVHYGYEEYGFFRKKVLAFLEKEIVAKADAVIAHTPEQKKFLSEKYRAKNVECIYQGLKLIANKRKKGSNVLFFGIISRKKGLELLVNAMKLLPECRLRIVGSFVDKKHEKKIGRMVKNAPNISFRSGWVSNDEREKYLKEADVLALPYLQAPYQSAVLHNAVSVGIPVVVTKTGSLHEIAERFRFGEIVEKNPKAIARGIRKVIKNYQSYRKGLTAYRKEANWKTVAQKHADVYEKLAAGKKPSNERT